MNTEEQAKEKKRKSNLKWMLPVAVGVVAVGIVVTIVALANAIEEAEWEEEEAVENYELTRKPFVVS